MLNIRRLPLGLYDENVYLAYLDGCGDALVVDPGDRADSILDAAKQAGVKISHILITHGHFDHILAAPGLRELSGARVLVHELDAHMLADPYPLKLPTQLLARFTPSRADELLTDQPFHAAGLRVQPIPTPGHTPGGLCYYLPEHKALFSGDTLFRDGFGRTDFAGGSVSDLRDSLLRLFQLPDDVMVYPGHGETGSMGEIRGRLLR